ncbi:MAG: flagellar biosynthesis anti-sigma factor FlgM [Spirochaetaceae bacterium]|jgi:negative regulator of flagellin synthesis FlgM|nr:flagellar biosynthesis anti-sigma factor FlgM [Spirochaetaceae bacterium]
MTIDRLGSVDPVAKYNKTNKTSKVVKKNEADSVNVSDEAKRSAELLKAAETAKSSPDIRMDRVEEVKAKLQDPNYINDKVLGEVADSIMDMFGIL